MYPVLLLISLMSALLFGSTSPIMQWFWVCCIGLVGTFFIVTRNELRSFSYVMELAENEKLFRLFVVILGLFMIYILGRGLFNSENLRIMEISHISVDQSFSTEPYFKLSFLVTHVLFFLILLNFFLGQPRKAYLAIAVHIFFTVLCAGYAITIYYTGNDEVLWYSREKIGNGASGNFVNRNNFASFLTMGLWCSLCLLLNVWSHAKNTADHFQRLPLILMLSCGSTIILAALILTKSRGGILTAVILLIFLVLFLGRFVRNTGKSKMAVSVVITVGFIVGIANFKQSILRFSAPNLGVDRLDLYREVWQLFAENPLLGYVHGNFESLLRLVNTQVYFYARKGHSDWLELIISTGLLGFLLVFWANILLLLFLFKRRSGEFSLLAGLIILQLSLHGLVDFPFQIFGITLPASLLLAASISLRSGKSHL